MRRCSAKTQSASELPRRITLGECDELFERIPASFRGECLHLREAGALPYLAPLSHFSDSGDRLLSRLKYDNSPAALRLWSFIFSEKTRLFEAKERGHALFAAMKDLGTVPVITYAIPETTTFYADEMWWTPCFSENSKLLDIASELGAGDDICFVRAALGAMLSGDYFPKPDLCIAAVGACCDDFSSVMQLIEWQGFDTHWWEMPSRKALQSSGERKRNISYMAKELEGVALAASKVAGRKLDKGMISKNIRRFNRLRKLVRELRRKVYSADKIPLPSLEIFLAEFIAPHACSEPAEAENVLVCLHREVDRRLALGIGPFAGKPVRIYWVNPPTDASLLTMLEDAGAVVCGSEYMISHSWKEIETGGDPFQALAAAQMLDPMSGTCEFRADLITREALEFRADGVIVSGIFGASHCPFEERQITDRIRERTSLPLISFDVPFSPERSSEQIRNRIESFIDVIRRSEK